MNRKHISHLVTLSSGTSWLLRNSRRIKYILQRIDGCACLWGRAECGQCAGVKGSQLLPNVLKILLKEEFLGKAL